MCKAFKSPTKSYWNTYLVNTPQEVVYMTPPPHLPF